MLGRIVAYAQAELSENAVPRFCRRCRVADSAETNRATLHLAVSSSKYATPRAATWQVSGNPTSQALSETGQACCIREAYNLRVQSGLFFEILAVEPEKIYERQDQRRT